MIVQAAQSSRGGQTFDAMFAVKQLPDGSVIGPLEIVDLEVITLTTGTSDQRPFILEIVEKKNRDIRATYCHKRVGT